MITELWYDMASDRPVKVGELYYANDYDLENYGQRVLKGMSEGYPQIYRLLTNVDIDRFKDALIRDHNLPNKEGLEIVVQYRSEDTKRLEVIEKGDWIDLYADESVAMRKGDWKLINLGVAMKLPVGCEAHVVPRSSTYNKWGIIQANHVGIIDNSYCGPNDWWMLSALATRDTTINRGDKICQFRIVDKQPKIRFVEGKMDSPDRGGFGSTGAK
jgi:dUTP pyrophosphatase